MAQGGKQPHLVSLPAPEKKPRIERDPDVVKDMPITWGLKFADLHADCKWSWQKVDPAHLESLHSQLVGMEGKTLHALQKNGGVKDIPAHHLKCAAKERLKELRLEEADTLWELRLDRKWRVWGLVEGSTFYFLWWDENETACNPPPKGERRR